MNKLLTVIAAALAASVIASDADAAFNVRLKTPEGFSEVQKAGCGGSGASRAYRRSAYQSVRRSKRAVASRTISKPAVVAAAKTPAPKASDATEETASVAKIENSSIATGDEVAAIAEKPAKKAGQKVAATGNLGCKTFFPSVGMTVSVACDKN